MFSKIVVTVLRRWTCSKVIVTAQLLSLMRNKRTSLSLNCNLIEKKKTRTAPLMLKWSKQYKFNLLFIIGKVA